MLCVETQRRRKHNTDNCVSLHLQELEEARRLYSSQKRALKDAMSAAAEREAAEVAAGESGLEAATAAAEEEVERLAQVGGVWQTDNSRAGTKLLPSVSCWGWG
jgi:hypothetical protein